jgi:phospholipid/cholesterol/gamma-HCH transport system substrate-binding protein
MAMSRQSQLRWSQVKIGLLVLIALTVLVAMIMNLEEGLGLLSRQTKFRAVVDHTQGLKVGGPVRMNGVDIGNVHRITIAGDSPRVEITFAVKSNVVPHIREDASVIIRPMGLLGDKMIEILPGTPSKSPLAPGGVLVGQAEADIGGIASTATDTIENVNSAIKELQRLLLTISQGEGTAGKLLTDPALYDRSAKVLEKIEIASEKSIALLDKVDRGEGTIGRLMTDKELYDRANRAVKELNDLAIRLNNQNGTLVKLTDPALYQRLEALTSRGEQLLNKVENGEGTIGKLVTKDELYTRADKLLSEMEEFLADVRKNPTKYFKFSVF